MNVKADPMTKYDRQAWTNMTAQMDLLAGGGATPEEATNKNEGYKDGFTVIDLENKIAYKGEDLYRYAYEPVSYTHLDVYKRQGEKPGRYLIPYFSGFCPAWTIREHYYDTKNFREK